MKSRLITEAAVGEKKCNRSGGGDHHLIIKPKT
jgi:hypothetical protein